MKYKTICNPTYLKFYSIFSGAPGVPAFPSQLQCRQNPWHFLVVAPLLKVACTGDEKKNLIKMRCQLAWISLKLVCTPFCVVVTDITISVLVPMAWSWVYSGVLVSSCALCRLSSETFLLHSQTLKLRSGMRNLVGKLIYIPKAYLKCRFSFCQTAILKKWRKKWGRSPILHLAGDLRGRLGVWYSMMGIGLIFSLFGFGIVCVIVLFQRLSKKQMRHNISVRTQ